MWSGRLQFRGPDASARFLFLLIYNTVFAATLFSMMHVMSVMFSCGFFVSWDFLGGLYLRLWLERRKTRGLSFVTRQLEECNNNRFRSYGKISGPLERIISRRFQLD